MKNIKLHAPNKENHRALWMWLAKHPDRGKEDWPGFRTMRKLRIQIPSNDCFLCEGFWLVNRFRDGRMCGGCPLSFNLEAGCEKDEKSPYRKFLFHEGNRRANALKIANCWK